ncbi:envelope stress response protein PspG [Pantoea sp. 1.19]|uniref:envelope stress response protein PspG n=1 Tax=Pantoea sp. 1.19 TaxID=1925589 RepID=UPI000948F166|nr:envelope stress response protein PspG [Pantoea sp. 1.19]
MELLFVLGFFVMLMLTGVSLLGVLAALAVATVVMVVGGLLMLVIHVLPWLLLAVAAVWLWRRWQGGRHLPRRWRQQG